MDFVECANFILNTCDVDLDNVGGVFNQYGKTNQYKNDTTWNNVSFKTILGDMYDKYDSFSIKLTNIIYQSIVAPSPNANDKLVKVNIAGLPFRNCTYNTYKNCNTNVFAPTAFLIAPQGSNLFYNDHSFTIERPPAMCDIRIYLTIMNNTVPNWASPGPQMEFYFRIYGIKKENC
jgi:hypothetical protein